MTFDPKQKEWLEKMTKAVVAKEKSDQRELRKAQLLDHVMKQVDTDKAAMQAAFAAVRPKLNDGSKSKLLDVKNTQQEEFDSDNDILNVKSWGTKEQVEAAARYTAKLVNWTEQLRNAEIREPDASGKIVATKLFTAAEITEDFWFPLTRERIAPDNFAPPALSKTQQMLDATNEIYGKVLEDVEDGDEVDLAEKGIAVGAKVARLGQQVAAAFGGGDAKIAGNAMELLALALDTTGVTYGAVKEADLEGASDKIVANLKKTTGKIISMAIPGDSTIGPTVAAAISATSDSTKALVFLYQGGEKAKRKAFDSFTSAVLSGLDAGISSTANSTTKSQLKEIRDGFAKAKIAGDAGTAILKKVKAGDLAGAVTETNKALQKIIIDVLPSGAQRTVADDMDAVTSLLESVIVISEAQGRGAADTIIDNIGTMLTTVITLAGKPEIGAQVGKAYIAAVQPVKIAKALAKKPEPDVITAVNLFANGFTIALQNVPPGQGVATAAEVVSRFQSAANAAALLIELRKTGDPHKFIEGMSKAAKAAVAAAVGPQDEDKQRDINGKLDLAVDALNVGAALVDAVKAKKIADQADTLVDSLGKVLAGALQQSGVDADICNLVQKSYSSAGRAVTVAGCLSKPKITDADISKSLEALGAGFEDALDACSTGASDSTALAMKTSGKGIAAAFKSAGKSVLVAKDIEDGKLGAAVKKLQAVAKVAVNASFEIATDVATDGLSSDEADAQAQELKDIQTNVNASLKTGTKMATLVVELKKPEKQKALKEKAAAKQNEEFSSEVAAANEEFTLTDEEQTALNQLRVGPSPASAAAVRKIEALIKQMKRDRAIMQTAVKLLEGGIDIVSKFVAPLRAGGEAIKLAANLVAAAQRATDLNRWLGVVGDMRGAQNPLSSSAKNFVSNQKEQLAHYAIQSALNLAKMIGSILECTGIGAAVATPLAAAATAASSAEEILRDLKKDAELEATWKLTLRAFKNPKNRKLGLLVRQKNATLAKYSIAWGAVVKNDALGKAALASCGLTERSLASPDADVGKVVEYLKARFPEDPEVLRKLQSKTEWVPSSLSLTFTCWTTILSAGVAADELHPDTLKGSGAVEASLVRLPQLQTAWKKAHGNLATAVKAKTGVEALKEPARVAYSAYLDELSDLRKALTSFKPLKKKKEGGAAEPRQEDMEVARDELAGLAYDELEDVKSKMVELQLG
jgi:hypothetical protein